MKKLTLLRIFKERYPLNTVLDLNTISFLSKYRTPLPLKFVVVLRRFPKPAGFVIPFHITDLKKVLRKFGELLLILRLRFIPSFGKFLSQSGTEAQSFPYSLFGLIPQRGACLGMEISEPRQVC